MKKPIIHEFDPMIYPRTLWVYIGWDKSIVTDRFELVYKDAAIMRNDSVGTVIPVIEKSTRNLGCVVVFRSKKYAITKNICHESVHVADYISEQLGIVGQNFIDLNESYAYLTGWVAGCIDEVVKNKL